MRTILNILSKKGQFATNITKMKTKKVFKPLVYKPKYINKSVVKKRIISMSSDVNVLFVNNCHNT